MSFHQEFIPLLSLNFFPFFSPTDAPTRIFSQGLTPELNNISLTNTLPFDPSEPKWIHILGYQRTGSSFTSGLLGTDDRVFFIFEPLEMLFTSLYGLEEAATKVPNDFFNNHLGYQRWVQRSFFKRWSMRLKCRDKFHLILPPWIIAPNEFQIRIYRIYLHFIYLRHLNSIIVEGFTVTRSNMGMKSSHIDPETK